MADQDKRQEGAGPKDKKREDNSRDTGKKELSEERQENTGAEKDRSADKNLGQGKSSEQSGARDVDADGERNVTNQDNKIVNREEGGEATDNNPNRNKEPEINPPVPDTEPTTKKIPNL